MGLVAVERLRAGTKEDILSDGPGAAEGSLVWARLVVLRIGGLCKRFPSLLPPPVESDSGGQVPVVHRISVGDQLGKALIVACWSWTEFVQGPLKRLHLLLALKLKHVVCAHDFYLNDLPGAPTGWWEAVIVQ